LTPSNEDPDEDLTEFTYNLRFPGQYLDDESGLHYNYFRDYDSVTGRYIQSDPLGLAGGLNPYLYANANPLALIDPFGLDEGSPANVARRRAIDQRARSYDQSRSWGYYVTRDDFGPETNKCNKFVFDVLLEAGAPAYYTPRGQPPRLPLAGDWADRNTTIPNWRVLRLGEKPQPGDVAAFPAPPGATTYTGHSGFITSCDCVEGGTSNISAHERRVNAVPLQFTREPGLTFRRYTGE
jgi:RHS repeat-associated protein